jgi:hypothetical protein
MLFSIFGRVLRGSPGATRELMELTLQALVQMVRGWQPSLSW